MYNSSGNESCNYHVFAQQYACNYWMYLHPLQLSTERNEPLLLSCWGASNKSMNPQHSQGSDHQHPSRRKRQAVFLLAGTQVKNDDWVPSRQQTGWEYKNPTNKEAERKSLKGAGCRGGNAAHPRQQMWLEKALACLSLALGCMEGMAPPHGNLSPSSAANRVGAEPTAGEQCIVLQPLSAWAAQNALMRESC